MPQKKKNTTLVTEDELMDAVSERVTDNIRREMEQRFASFERALDRIVPRGPPEAAPEPAQTGKRPAEDELYSQPRAPRGAVGNVQDRMGENSQSSSSEFVQPGSLPPVETPAAPITRESTRSMTSRPEVPRPPLRNVNNNNNTATWNAWQQIQQPFSSHQSGLPGASREPDDRRDQSLEEQVRYIMEATPNQLTGKPQTGGFLYPYKYVTRGPEKRRLSFNNVTLAEHIWGLFRMLDDECTDPSIKPYLLSHMKEVAEDACEYEWNTHVRRWSEEVFCMVAEKRLPDGWRSSARIQNLRTGMSRVDTARLPIIKDNGPQKKHPAHAFGSDPLKGGPPCAAFNTTQGCSLQSGHMMNGVKQLHVCSYCLANTAATHPHPEARCRTKQRHAAAHF